MENQSPGFQSGPSSTTYTPTSTGMSAFLGPQIYRQMMERQGRGAEVGFGTPAELAQAIELVGGFATPVMNVADLNMKAALGGVMKTEEPLIRERLRNLLSASNQFPDLGPQDKLTRAEALKYAAGLPNKIQDKLEFLRRSKGISKADLNRLRLPLVKALNWAEGVYEDAFGGRTVGRGAPAGIRAVATPLGKLPQGSLVPVKEIGLHGMPDSEQLQNMAAQMLELARTRGAPLPSPALQAQVIRHYLGFPSEAVAQFDYLTDAVSRGSKLSPEGMKQLQDTRYALAWAGDLFDQLGKGAK